MHSKERNSEGDVEICTCSTFTTDGRTDAAAIIVCPVAVGPTDMPMDDVRFSLCYAPVTRMEYGRGGEEGRRGHASKSMGNNRVANWLFGHKEMIGGAKITDSSQRMGQKD